MMSKLKKSGIALPLSAMLMSGGAWGATAERTLAGALPQGGRIEAITLKNQHGVSARILTYGATLQSLIAPDRQGHRADVLLGYDDAITYATHPNFFGATIGRYANRIAGGRFSLDGKTYQLPLNEKAASLHGGGKGFDTQLWRVLSVADGPAASVVLGLRSPEGDSGYPGQLDVTVTYSLDEQGALRIVYDATTTKPTVVNMTNHALFNLAGEGTPTGATLERLTIPAQAYTPVDDSLIPTGKLQKVAGTVFDFRRGRIIAEGIRDGTDAQIRVGHGYDHNFALDKGVTRQPALAARLEDPASGRVLDVLSTEPGLQFYTGNFLNGTLVGKSGHLYRMGDGIALEPQKFPDAPNEPSFISARIDPGKPYQHVMIYRLSTTQ
jgi:aldose 1-epimerase